MKLEYAGVSKENLKSGIDIFAIKDSDRNSHISNIFDKKVSDMLGWVDLPDMSSKDINEMVEFGKFVNNKFKNFIVLGIGGSALGIKMLKNTFVDSLHKKPATRVEVIDNIDSDYFISLLNSIDLYKTMFNVITKSGSTSETLSQMSIIIDMYKERNVDYTEHFVITTEKGNDLYNFAMENDIKWFEVPKSVGGRFSVLSPVGLVPACVMEIDIVALLKGAKKQRDNSKQNSVSNIAYTSAYINYTYLNKGLVNLVTMPYSDRLALVPDFFAQLWGESLGKRYDREGREVFAGQTPIKTLGVTDQHSQLQLYSEGPLDKVIMFMAVDKPSLDVKLSGNLSFAKHLDKVTLKNLMDYEYESTAYSLTTLDRPNYTIRIKCVDEENVGKLIMFMEMLTAYMGEMMGVNTYDQPGVELSKKFTKGCLGVKGYEEHAKNLKEYKKNIIKFSL